MLYAHPTCLHILAIVSRAHLFLLMLKVDLCFLRVLLSSTVELPTISTIHQLNLAQVAALPYVNPPSDQFR